MDRGQGLSQADPVTAGGPPTVASPRAAIGPGTRTALLLTPPMLWLGVAYLGALGALFVTAFWGQNSFTGELERTWTLDNFRDLVSIEVYRTITWRTLGAAALVTLIDTVLAFPVALVMAKLVSPRWERILLIAVLTPLWASYLVKAYAWRGMLSEGGFVDRALGAFGMGSPGFGFPAVVVTLSYLWLPYMILPLYAGLSRLPDSTWEASADLGAPPLHTMRRVVLPLMLPAVVAGSVFTFSLTLGDYIAVKIVGGANQMLGNVVYDSVGAANNLPFGAAVATVPVVVMLAYLAAARRMGALESL